ncbi:MAG: hypothetical protein QXK37_02550 [Candidatus Woesearchaeota archaeon]
MSDEELNAILEKYRKKLMSELGENVTEINTDQHEAYTREYLQFKRDLIPKHFTLYEKACNISEKILRIHPDKKKEKNIQECINTCHLNITPSGAASFAILAPFIVIILGVMLTIAIPFGYAAVFKPDTLSEVQPSFFFIFVSLIAGLAIMFPLQKMPEFLTNSWRLQASNQMVLCIFYIVTYMRHTSNLEHAIEFASSHLSGPLALDLRKVLWDVETEKFSTLKESLDYYLESWRMYNMEFIESLHLIESSLYESSESRRLDLLDKSLDVILEETYEKMLHYAHNLKSPITMLHMLGIILPILGLVILPLVVNFMGGIKWYYLATLYNIALPLGVYYLGRTILAQRPTGYGDTDISEEIPSLKKLKKVSVKIGTHEILISPFSIAVIIAAVMLLIALSPIVLHIVSFDDVCIDEDYCLLEYKEDPTTGQVIGPFGIGAAILSLFFPLAFGIGVGTYYKLRSENIIKVRENAKKLEKEFASALFQLGNRLGDGYPAEVAFGKVADVMEGTTSGSFFRYVSTNIQKMGMSVTDAIFNPKSGAIIYFPSKIIESSMKVLTQSIKKGPQIAAQALVNVSRYIKEMHKVNERLKDLLADVIASMKSQISILTPAIAGIVVGITSMITNILGKIGPLLQKTATEEAALGGTMSDFFGLGIPTYYFQLMVGIYVVQIVYILTILSNGIENGSDSLNEDYLLGQNLIKSTVIYVVIALMVMIIFNFIANMVLTQTLSGGIV